MVVVATGVVVVVVVDSVDVVVAVAAASAWACLDDMIKALVDVVSDS